ncbi:MAG: bifunctional 2-C-methyl-D-erythritol 4-phosphate cytidylyltransferase/2-C-methyl-D-erythritol 2,4-cyclodiphosphate synthase [Sphingobium sp.]
MRTAMTAGTNHSIALIVAAGQGSRAGGDIAKQFRAIAGTPVLAHAVQALASHPAIKALYVVVAPGQEESARMLLAEHATGAPVADIVTGGDTRRASVRAGLERIARTIDPAGADHVLIHDAARPFLPHAVIDRLLGALADHAGAIPVLPVSDTLVRAVDGLADAVVDRDGLFRVQTPQAFRLAPVLAVHRTWDEGREATDDAQMMRRGGHDVMVVRGDERLEKLTYAEDFDRAEARLAARRIVRVGMGYDVHRLVSGEPLWLGGVQIPHDRGLSGHSDADVAIHAIVDALLGALAEGDIGSHFPPSDPQWRGAPSSRFLTYARDRVTARGGRIDHVDLTLICEAPKIGPHRQPIRARLTELLAVGIDAVSVKATTTEKLGFAGRGEGIAAQAVATLSLPA